MYAEVVNVAIPQPWLLVSCQRAEAKDGGGREVVAAPHTHTSAAPEEAVSYLEAVQPGGVERLLRGVSSTWSGDKMGNFAADGCGGECGAEGGSSSGSSGRCSPDCLGESDGSVNWAMPAGAMAHEAFVAWGTLLAILAAGTCVCVFAVWN